MAEFHDPTVVQQPIPWADLTPLEHLVLTRIFDVEETGGGLLLHAALGPRESIAVSIGEVRTALAASASVPGRLVPFLSERLPDNGVTDGVVAFDLSGLSWSFVLQDIVRRSPSLPYVTAVTAFTCTAMRPDGFGGMAVLITADVIRSVSTNDILETWLADGAVRREHRLPRLVEDEVRAEDPGRDRRRRDSDPAGAGDGERRRHPRGLPDGGGADRVGRGAWRPPVPCGVGRHSQGRAPPWLHVVIDVAIRFPFRPAVVPDLPFGKSPCPFPTL